LVKPFSDGDPTGKRVFLLILKSNDKMPVNGFVKPFVDGLR